MKNLNDYDQDPRNALMRSAIPNPAYYNLYYPFTPCDEEFKNISSIFPEIRDYYWISNYGRVYNANTGYLTLPRLDEKSGFLMYSLKRTSDAKDLGLHKDYSIAAQNLVCPLFNGPKPGPGYLVLHLDSIKTNNYYKNLVWGRRDEIIQDNNNDNYWNGNVYVNAKRSEDQIRKICEMLQAGITNPTEISLKVFGTDPDPSIYSLIRHIKDRTVWTSVSKDYNFDGLGHRNFTPDYIIEVMCLYMQNNPNSAYTASLDEILQYSNIDISTIDKSTLKRYKMALHQLRYKGAYKKITSNYNIPKE